MERAFEAASPPVEVTPMRATVAALCANLVGIGLARFGYTPLIPALISANWFTPIGSSLSRCCEPLPGIWPVRLGLALLPHAVPLFSISGPLLTLSSFDLADFPKGRSEDRGCSCC
jgi:hypothetical protein